MGSGKVGIEGDSFFKFFDRFGQKTSLAIGSTKNDAQLWPVAKLFEHAFVNLLRRRQLVPLEIGES